MEEQVVQFLAGGERHGNFRCPAAKSECEHVPRVGFFLGEEDPNPEALMKFTLKVIKETSLEYFAFSPTFTICNECKTNMRGIKEICEKCGSHDTTGFDRVTGYLQAIENWNEAKKEEQKNRQRFTF